MSNIFHKDYEVADGIHRPYSFEYADTAARTGATGLTADDVNKWALQQDDDSLWQLTNHSPVTWKQIDTQGFDANAIHSNVAGEIIAITEKVAPIAADVIIINDTEDSNNPKHIQIGNITPSPDEKVKVSSNDTTADYLDAKIIVADEANSANILEVKEVGDGGDEDLKIAIDETKIDHTNIANKGLNTHAQIDTHISATNNPHSTDIENLGSGTLAELNDAISDATLLDSGDIQYKTGFLHTAADHQNGGGLEINVAGLSGVLADSQTPSAHAIGGAEHSADTLANLNLKISDATLLDTSAIQFKTGSLHTAADHENGGGLEISLAGLNGEAADAQKTAISKNSGAIVGTRKELNLIEGENINLTIADDAGNDEVDITIKSFPEYNFHAESFENPTNASWAVNSLADIWRPTSNPTMLVRAFDDTTEEGVGFTIVLPTGATNIIFYFKSYAATAPGTARQVVPRLYTRTYADNSAIGSWSAGLDLTAIDIPTNAYPQYDTQTIALSTLSLTAGNLIQFELTRDPTDASDDLVGDWWLHLKTIRFS